MTPMEPSRMALRSKQRHGSEVERRTRGCDAQPGAAHEGEAGFERRSRSRGCRLQGLHRKFMLDKTEMDTAEIQQAAGKMPGA